MMDLRRFAAVDGAAKTDGGGDTAIPGVGDRQVAALWQPHSRCLAPMTFAALMLAACLSASDVAAAEQTAADATADVPERIEYAQHVQPILAKRCYSCHGPDVAESGLNFSAKDSAFAETLSGERAIVPGDVEESLLIRRITTDDEFARMPPEGDPLPEEEIAVLTRWIEQGAKWNKHWAFRPVQAVDPPEVADAQWAENPIDAFIYASLDEAGLEPNPAADRATLIRRAYYDLTGLPPSAEQVQAFLADEDPLAFERLVDRLLESPHYGERWGRHWLDLVRYAETNSFERDAAKPNAWKYRDYVIESFNEDKPYDQFVREQLAGDELDEVTTETLTATGYYRLGIWDDEPADPLQAKYDEMDDIITTTSQVFLGLTINCARCHDHKIDPIPQSDYYSMLALLADVTSYGTRGDQRANNQIDVSSPELKQAYRENHREQRRLQKELRKIEQAGIAKMSAPDQRATEGPKQERQEVLDAKLQDHLSEDQWAEYRELKGQLQEVETRIEQLPPRETVLGLARCEAEPEPTHVMNRGNPHTPGEEVAPSFPELFGEPVPEIPPPGESADSAGRRRVLADWIASPENMLTARVMANRIWQYHFGRGIVRSSNNFGQLGTPPTHPKLLDWLAQRLIESGWRLKPMHRLIMTSRVYQLSSATQPRGVEIDPNNDRFWRFDPRRLSAEEVRDSILAANGTLNRKLYGPSFYPELSQEVLASQSRPGKGWGESSDRQRDRRSIYIHVKRSLLTPLLKAFDLPTPDRSCEARFATLQPGQALALLNSDFLHEQAAQLAESIGAAESPDEQIVRRTVQAVLSREATETEIRDGVELIGELEREYGVGRQRAVQLYCLSVLNWNEFVFLD